MDVTLLYRVNRGFFLGGVILYLTLFLYWGDSLNYYNIMNVSTFVGYAYLLWTCLNKPDEYFTPMRLGMIVFLYSSIFVCLYLLLSYTYSDYVLLFNRLDAQDYEKHTARMVEMNTPAMFSYISHVYTFDDWGTPLLMTWLMKVISSKYFVLFCQILMNVVSALCLFSISKTMMTRKYGFMAVLSYAISSYSVFFMSSMLKEEAMVMLIILSFYFLYRYRVSKDVAYIGIGGLLSLLLLFFRVPLAVFLWVVYAVTLLMDSKGHLQRGLVIMIILMGIILSVGMIQYSSDRYVSTTASYMFETTSVFRKVVISVGALIGPFPNMIQLSSQTINYKPMFAPGALYKFLLFFPFWKGFIYCIKSKSKEIAPIFLFCMLEIVGLTSVFDGLELRKAFPHFALFLLAAFWYMSRFDEDTNEEIRHSHYYYWTYRGFTVSLWIVFVVTLAWNTLNRVTNL